MRAEFEEKQYEIAACIELATGAKGNRVFSSGQMLEDLVGYDAAADPGPDHVLWELLRLPRPKGIVLLPQYWKSAAMPGEKKLPRSAVSVILQFKRPEYLRHPNAAQWHLWRKPFFRFSRQAIQHQVLVGLEGVLEGEALVRYASPAFLTLGMLELAQLTETVLASTGFVRPTDIGNHKTWTYIEPGSDGRANPRGRFRSFETIDELFASVDREGTRQSTSELALPGREMSLMSDTLRHRRPTLRKLVDPWLQVVERADLGLSVGQLGELRDYVTVQSMIRKIEANWLLIDRT